MCLIICPLVLLCLLFCVFIFLLFVFVLTPYLTLLVVHWLRANVSVTGTYILFAKIKQQLNTMPSNTAEMHRFVPYWHNDYPWCYSPLHNFFHFIVITVKPKNTIYASTKEYIDLLLKTHRYRIQNLVEMLTIWRSHVGSVRVLIVAGRSLCRRVKQ